MKFRGGAVLIAVVLLASAAVPASAQRPVTDRLTIDIGLVEISGKPGGRSGDRFKLINRTDTPVDVTAFVEDLGTNADGDLVAVPRGSTDLPSAAAWVSVSDEDVSVPANGTATVDATIVVPPRTRAGGYYASITFDSDNSGSPESRVTHAILVRIDGRGFAPSGRIVSVEMATPSFSGRVPIEVTVENSGNLHAVGGGSIDITDTFGTRVARLAIPTVVVLPQRQRIVTVTYDSPPVAARLKATATVSFRNGESTASDAGFVLIWWLAAMLVAVLMLFLVSLVRMLGWAGPKAAARRAARPAAVVVAPVARPEAKPDARLDAEPEKTGRRLGRKRPAAEQPGAAAQTPRTPPISGPPPLAPVPPVSPPGAAPVPPRPRHDESFWGPDDDETPAPRVRDEPDVEPLPVEEPSAFAAWTLEDEEELGEDLFDEEDAGEDESAAGDEQESDDRDEDDRDDDDRDDDDLDAADEDRGDDEESSADDEQAGAPLGADEDSEATTGDVPAEEEASWPDAADTRGGRTPAASRPVPVVLPPGRGKAPAQPPRPETPASTPDDEPAPLRPTLRPAARIHEVKVAGLPPLRESKPLPESGWAASPPDRPLDRLPGGSAMALRRAEVAIRMISGKPGETGAILDSGLDLLYSVRNDPAVVARVEQAYEETRNRRKLGPLALALFAVDSRTAPEALLDAFATASKVVAERIRRAILACDPADIRPHRSLIQALPQGRRDQLGL